MTESISGKSNLGQRNIFVKGFEKGSFHIFREEIVGEADLVYVFIVLKGVDDVD